MCPHTPVEACACRKPKPGMLLQAASDFAIDLHRSVFIGDALSDIQAGQAAGIQKNILVKTGLGIEQQNNFSAVLVQPYLTVDTLLDAVAHINL